MNIVQIMKRVKDRIGIIFSLLIFVVTLFILELLIMWSGIPDYILPRPSSVFEEFAIELASGFILKHMLVTVSETLVGFLVAFTVGTALAVVVDMYKTAREVIQPYITAFQAMPKIALAPIVVLWFGFGISSKIVLVVLISFFLVFINVLNGLRSVRGPMLELMHSYRATKRQILLTVKFPNALPFIFTGVEAAILYSLTAAVVGEFVGAKEGLGYLIQLWSMQLKTASSFASILMLVIVALVMVSVLEFVKKKALFWEAKT